MCVCGGEGETASVHDSFKEFCRRKRRSCGLEPEGLTNGSQRWCRTGSCFPDPPPPTNAMSIPPLQSCLQNGLENSASPHTGLERAGRATRPSPRGAPMRWAPRLGSLRCSPPPQGKQPVSRKDTVRSLVRKGPTSQSAFSKINSLISIRYANVC